eukprot:768068-Hanusia_phi.AAC.1
MVHHVAQQLAQTMRSAVGISPPLRVKVRKGGESEGKEMRRAADVSWESSHLDQVRVGEAWGSLEEYEV